MKKKRKPDRSDLEAIRAQLLDFACAKHDFEPEVDTFLADGGWRGVFAIRFRDRPGEERLCCEAPLGEHHVRFTMTLEVDEDLWRSERETIVRFAAEHDVALRRGGGRVDAAEQGLCQLSTRAWIPGFSQRIFGLTLSNLLYCKRSITALVAER